MRKKFRENIPSRLSDSVKENIDTVAEFYDLEEEKISGTQSAIEIMSCVFSSPIYFSGFVIFVFLWILANAFAIFFGWGVFDPAPYFWLQGIVGLNGVLITIAVLIRQSRMERLAELHAHLNLQVNLLAEQKTTKIIQLLEELRRDSPNVKNRIDPEIEAMQMLTDTHAVLHAIDAHKTHKLDVKTSNPSS